MARKTLTFGRFNDELQKVTFDQCLALQFASITQDQAIREPSSYIRCGWGKGVAKDLQNLKRKKMVKGDIKYHKRSKNYCTVGLGLTRRGMKALSACGGKVFLTPKRR